ncbi:FG-GAP-like repeat-containing protein [Propionibacteriaceae bacterium G1746]
MRDQKLLVRLVGVLAAAATAFTLSISSLAGTATADPTTDPTEQGVTTRSEGRIHTPKSPMDESKPGGLAPQGPIDSAVALLNGYRSKVGARSVVYDSSLASAVQAHANYLELNKSDPNLNPAKEESGKPGYTAAGAAIAPWTLVSTGVSANGTAIDLWMMDPWERSARLLHPLTNGIAFGKTATFLVAGVNFNNSAPQVWPQVFPNQSNQRSLAFNSTAASYYASNCTQKPAVWGFPITVQWDHQNLGAISGVTASLYRDGVPVPFCLISNPDALDINAQVVIMPTAPLVPGSYYSGSVSGTAAKTAGGTQSVNATISFTTYADNRVWGDQTGDHIGDLLGIDAAGNLRIYKGVKPGRFGTSWIVGSGWGQFTWFSHTPDINGDKRDDLIGRRADGNLYLYYGQGMGSYSSGKRVGTSWNGLDNITVVGDMTGDGTPEVVGIGNAGANDGKLFRYTLTNDGFIGASQIGKNWQGIKQMTSVGSFNGDAAADIIAIGDNGNLYVYYTSRGNIIQAAQVGRGWNGFTALFSPGDLTGDGRPDIVGRNAAGTLYSYANQQGSFGSARQAGTNWNGFRLFG